MKRLPQSMSILLVFSLMLTSSCALYKKSQVSDSVDLQFKLPVNQSVILDIKSDSQITSEQMGQTIDVKTESTNKLKVTGLSQEASGMKVQFESLELTQSAESPMGGGETDFSDFIGLKTTGMLSAKGVLTDLQGYDKFPSITNAMGEPVNGELIKGGMPQLFFKIPDEPIKVGSTWSEPIESETPYGGGVLTTKGTVEYVVLERAEIEGMDCFKIQATSSSKTSGEFQQQGMDISLDRNGKSTSLLVFAIEKGFYVSQESSTIADGLVDVPAANLTIPQTIKSTSKVTVTF